MDREPSTDWSAGSLRLPADTGAQEQLAQYSGARAGHHHCSSMLSSPKVIVASPRSIQAKKLGR